jgi:hypothetical protein
MGRIFNTDQQSDGSTGGRIFGGKSDVNSLLTNINETKNSFAQSAAISQKKRLEDEAKKQAEVEANKPINQLGRIFGGVLKVADDVVGDFITPEPVRKLQEGVKLKREAIEAAINKDVASGKITQERANAIRDSLTQFMDNKASTQTKRLVSGAQQGAGNVADIALQGGAALNALGNETNPFINNEKRQLLTQKNLQNTERFRNRIKETKTVTGESLNPYEDYRPSGDLGQDIVNVGGRSLMTGLDATALTGLGIGPAVGIVRTALKTQAKEVVQVINKATGEKTFYRIPKSERDSIVNAIDNDRTGNAIAGKNREGLVTHVTARSPKEMTKLGFVDGGVYGGFKKSPLQKLDEAVSLAGKRTLDKALATTVGQKVDEALTTLQSKFQASTAPIYKQLNELQTAGRLTENEVKNVKSLIQTSRFNSGTMANDFLRNDEAAQTLLAPVNGKLVTGKTKTNLSDYINARNELNLIELDKKRGVKVSLEREAAFRKQVADLGTADFEARFDADVAVNRKLTDLLVDEGIVSPAQRDAWRKTNTEYIRVQRLLEGQSEIRGQGGGSRVSRGSTIASQKRKGSTKKASDALETVVDRTNRVFAEITSNRAANAYIDALTQAGAVGKQLRSAEKVANRQELRDALRFSAPLKKQLARFEKSQLKYVRRIQTEIDKLNRLGLTQALSKEVEPNLAGKLANPGARLSVPELKSVLSNLVENADPKALSVVKRQIAKREPKLAAVIDELKDIQDRLAGVNAQRLNQYNEAAKLADEAVRGRPTIQRFKDGIKEVYETTPEIEKAAKGLGPVYMGTLGRIISAPVRFFQSTITGGLNPAWAAIALPRDFIEGLVLSRRAAQTHNPFNVVTSTLEAAGIKHSKDDLFNKFMSYERGASSVIDITRGAKSNARAIRELSRQTMPKFKRTGAVIKSPQDWYATIQDVSKWNEYTSKYQNFRGNYNKLIKEGVAPDEAMNIALYEGRNATGNLLEQGDWTKPLAALYPYINPAIQGGTTLAKALRDRPIATSLKIIGAVQVPAVIATAWNMSDPRRAEAYLDISADERERYTIVVLPGSEKTDGKWQTVKIPKAPGVGMLANPIERFMVELYGEDPGQFEQTWQSLVKAFGSPIDPNSPSSAVGSAIPFQIKPFVEGAANYSFYKGKEIVPDWIKEANPDEPFKQAFDESPSTFKKIGKALGISPLIVENFARNTTGEFGQNTLWLSDVVQELAGVSEGGTGGRSPIESVTRGYMGSYGGARQQEVGAQIDKVFTSKQAISTSITEALAKGDRETANRLANEYNQTIDQANDFIEKNKRALKISDKTRSALDNNRFPVKDGQLSLSSIKARLKNLNK